MPLKSSIIASMYLAIAVGAGFAITPAVAQNLDASQS